VLGKQLAVMAENGASAKQLHSAERKLAFARQKLADLMEAAAAAIRRDEDHAKYRENMDELLAKEDLLHVQLDGAPQ